MFMKFLEEINGNPMNHRKSFHHIWSLKTVSKLYAVEKQSTQDDSCCQYCHIRASTIREMHNGLHRKGQAFIFCNFPATLENNKAKPHKKNPFHLSLIDGISGLNLEIKKDKAGWTLGQLLNQTNIQFPAR